MKPHFGILLTDSDLGKRIATLTLLRLLFLSALLGIIGRWQIKTANLLTFSHQVAIIALGVGFTLAALYALVLRSGRHLQQLVRVQLVFDQLTWTALVYVSGGATSGATSLYGLTVLVGAVVGGVGDAAIAAAVGYTLYASLTTLMIVGCVPIPPDQLDVSYATTIDKAASPLAVNLLVLIVVTLLASFLAERLRHAGGKLKEANDRALRAERLAFLGQISAVLAHEIRNPLGSISASIELLRDSPSLGKDDQHLCDIVRRESQRLNDLVSDMLDLGKPQKPSKTSTDIVSSIRDVVTLASLSGHGSEDVHVVSDIPPDVETCYIDADPSQLRQMFWNLVRNAVQATSPGTQVSVKLNITDNKHFLVEVIDNGTSVSEDVLSHMFEAFFTTRVRGAGIGLAVVKRIVDDHGWTIDAQRNDSGGTTIRVGMHAPEEA